MAISAVNSLNINRVAFRAAEPVSKPAAETKSAEDENFFEENKEVLLTLSAIGAAVLGAVILQKSGKSSKAADAAADIKNRAFDGTIGTKNILTIDGRRTAVEQNRLMEEFGKKGTRHAERAASGYEKALPEIFKEGATAHKREDVIIYNKVLEAKQAGEEITPEDFTVYAKVAGLDLSELVK